MNSIKTKRNTFFKKNVIGTGLTVTPTFPDLSSSTATSFDLSEGTSAQSAFILSGSVPDQPSYGAGELKAGVLRMYCSDINMKFNRELPSLTGYAIDKNIDVKEGAYSFSVSGAGTEVVGNNLGTYAIFPFSDVPQLVEDFEGSPDNLEVVNRVQGNAMAAMSDPYITETQLKALLKSEGHQNGEKRISHMRTILNPQRKGGSWVTGKKMIWVEVGSGTDTMLVQKEVTSDVGNLEGDLMYTIEFYKGNVSKFQFKERHSSWTANAGNYVYDQVAYDFARSVHSLPFKDINFLKLASAPSSTEGNPEADKGNTILSDFYATRNFSNPFDTTTDDPMITSTIELSAEKALNGGQSLRMYHNWGFAESPTSTMNEVIQNQLQESGNINPQCSRVSLYDIPYPSMPTDIGASTFPDGSENFGDPRSVIPELRVGINVTKLEPNVMLNIQNGTSAGFASAPVWQIAEQTSYGAGSKYSLQENTFLRSVVVTFSNYKPKKSHTTLDKFLYYGLDNYYTGKESDNIVGGVVFTRFGIDGDVASSAGGANNMFAYPLPVMKIMQTYNAGSPNTNNYTLAQGGLGLVLPGSSTPVGGAQMTTENIDTLVWGNPAAPPNETGASAIADDELPYVNLPMNSWLNMRCFFDIMQYNNSGSCTKRPYAPSVATNPTATNIGDRGVPMRVIFDTEGANGLQTVYNETNNAPALVSGGSRIKQDTRNLPFLDVFFPSHGSGAHPPLRQWSWNDNPEFWPKHMTIWVQNYPWVEGGATKLWRYGEQGLYPSGAAREAEVYIDNIQMFNFEAETKNVSTRDIVNFKPATHLSPIQKMYTPTGPKYKSGWVDGSPTVITGTISLTANSESASIVDNQTFDNTFLDSRGPTKLTSTSFVGTRWIRNFKNRLAFRMTNSASEVRTFTGSPSTGDVLRVAGTYTGVTQSSTSGDGTGAEFTLVVAAGTGVITSTLTAGGIGYAVDDIIAIYNSKFGGAGGLINLVVTGIDPGFSTGDATCVITCSGTTEPWSNRANLTQYDTGMHVALGVDHPDHLTTGATGAGAAGYTGYILGNDFSTYSWAEVNENLIYPDKAITQPTNASGAIFSQQITSTTAADGVLPPDYYKYVLGGDFLIGGPGLHTAGTQIDNVSGAAFQVYKGTTAAVGSDMINLGISSAGDFAATNDFFSLDGFRQKGFMYLNVSGSGTAKPSAGNQYPRTRWGKREHVGVSTKIINLADTVNSKVTGYEQMKSLNKNQIEVVNPSLFNFENTNERYVAYLMAASGTVSSITKFKKGGLKLAEPPTENIITFTQDLYKASDDSTPLFVEQNLHRLYIGPEKYWLTMMFNTDETNTERTYSSFCTIGSVPSLSGDASSISGTTYSEFQYNYNASAMGAGTGGEQALYNNEWNLLPIGGNSTLVTSLDYGYGAMEDEASTGGYMIYGSIQPSHYNYYPLNALSNNYSVGDNIPIILYLEAKGGQQRSATFFSDDYTGESTHVPEIYWSYLDLPPIITNLTVEPATNVVEGSTDLYDLTTETLNEVRFLWTEENADDVWYRTLIVDSKPISDKYHSCTMRLPLNEEVRNFAASPTYNVYNPSTQASAALAAGTTGVGADVRAVLEGQGGYAPVLSTTANGKVTVPTATNTGLDELSEFSLIIHWTPSLADKGVKRYIATQAGVYGTAADSFFLYKDTDETIHCDLGAGITLRSVKSTICDGETPTNIIFTLNTGSNAPNKANLYIDGTWQDGSAGETLADGAEDFVLGGFYVASTYTGSTGMFEEVLIYNKELKVVNDANEYIMPTIDIDDFADAAANNSLNKVNLTHNARLFVFDYHNFRGYNTQEIGMSNQTSWRNTTV